MIYTPKFRLNDNIVGDQANIFILLRKPMSQTTNSGTNKLLSERQEKQWEFLQIVMQEIDEVLEDAPTNIVGFEQLFDVLKHCMHFGGETQSKISKCLDVFMPMVGIVGPLDSTVEIQETVVKLQYAELRKNVLALGQSIRENPVAEVADTNLQIRNTQRLAKLYTLRPFLERESRGLSRMLQ